MRALTVRPGESGSARLDDWPEPAPPPGFVTIATSLVGVCGTDREIVSGSYGAAPAGDERLVIGHEALGRVVAAGGELTAGDLVVPIVRQPDPAPCGACAAGEWDMCQNGLYTEHGIKGAHGFARDRFAIEPSFVVAVPASLGDRAVLVEPASVAAKAWEQIERIAARAYWAPRVALVTGAGPVGLLAALMARQRGFETHVLDRVDSGPKPELVAALGADYHATGVADAGPPPDIVVECTGVGSVVLDVMQRSSRTGIVCLAGISSGSRAVELDAAALNRRLVLENDVVFGTVNANRRHYEAAVRALADADPGWLDRVITRRVRIDDWQAGLSSEEADVKVVLDFAA